MAMKFMSYKEARHRMKEGDVIAFGGSSHFSGIIKMAVRAEVSHIGIILQAHVKNGNDDDFFHEIIDSTSRNGVAIWKLRDRVDQYDGEVWWLPLRQAIWEKQFDRKAFYDFLFEQAKQKKKYDRLQAAGSAIDMFDALPFGIQGPGYNKEDFSRFFCSELVAAGLEVAGAVPEINASEATPIDICRWNIFESNYYMLKGDQSKHITQYNSLDPSAWDV